MTSFQYPADGRLAGKVAIVTGGARGIGEGIVRAFVAQSASVVIADRLEAEGAALAAELGDRAVFAKLDVTNPADWDAAITTALDRFGSLSVLVNNAGIAEYDEIGMATLDSWNRQMAVNATGPFIGITAAVDALAASAPSSIVNVSSISGLRGSPTAGAYVASKYAILGLTKVAALDLAYRGIRANSIHPGLIATPLSRSVTLIPEDNFQPHVPLKRNGQPHEIAMAAVFLASDESSYVTGAEIAVDGGQTAGPVRAATTTDDVRSGSNS